MAVAVLLLAVAEGAWREEQANQNARVAATTRNLRVRAEHQRKREGKRRTGRVICRLADPNKPFTGFPFDDAIEPLLAVRIDDGR